MKMLFETTSAILFSIWIAASANAQTITGAYWDDSGPVPALYFFSADNTGVRTTYPQGGQLQYASPFPFAWAFSGNTLFLQYGSGYTDAFVITGYDPAADIIARQGIGQSQQLGPGPWFGCASGRVPPVIAASLC